MSQNKSYTRPEVFELGAAATLTLGGQGCSDDGEGCKKFDDPTDF